MRVLPDTSIWVEYLRHGAEGAAWELDGLLERDAVVVCGPVVAELLTGANLSNRGALWRMLRGMSWTPLGPDEWGRVGEVCGLLRERGQTVPLTDVCIAVSAIAGDATLWTADADFARIEAVAGDLRRYRAG